MSLLGLISVLILVGILLWAVNSLIPMDPTIKKIVNVLVIVIVVIWLLQSLGVLGSINSMNEVRIK